MKYQQLVLGIVVGIAICYCGFRVVHHLQRVGDISSSLLNVGQPAQADGQKKTENAMSFSQVALDAHAKLGEVIFDYDFVPSSSSHNAVMQIFLNVGGNWQEFTPSDSNGTIVFHLFKDLDCSGSFKIDLPKGTYTAYRIILFDASDGTDADYSKTLWDSKNEKHLALPKLDLTVESSVAPVETPILAYPPNPIEESGGSGSTTVTIPAMVKYPKDYQVENGGFWVMAKGTGGFSQVWADEKNAVDSSDLNNPFKEIPISLVLKDLKPGIWNVNFGLFKQSFGNPIEWIFPGLDFEVGGSSWETLAPQRRIPPRLQVIRGKFELLNGSPYNFYQGNPSGLQAASFIRGGNYGNAITRTLQPALDTPGFFTLLAETGCHYIRFNYNPDRYLNERVYQNSVDQIIQNIWTAGLYPVIAPQDLPQGDNIDQRVALGQKLMKMIATKYVGKSVWIEECNEPQEFQSWRDWKPVAEEYVKTIRSIDPHAMIIVPLQFFSKDSAEAAASPITDVHVDLYDGHAYVGAGAVKQAFGPATAAGLPLMIGEYGSNDPNYLHQMDQAFQALSPSPVAVSPWAFTIKGEDSLPLVQDGSSAELVFTPAGQAIADDYKSWDNGQRVQ